MVEFLKHWMVRQEVLDTLFKVFREAAERKLLEYSSAVRIQSWFRGLRVRFYLKILNNAAVIIQKNFKGYLARKHFRARIKECLEEVRINYYHKNATCIQRYWKGYYVRKYVHNYYALKAYLEGLTVKNDAVLEQLKSHEQFLKEEEKANLEKLDELNFEQEVIQKHHMMSTQSMAGVFNPPTRKNPDPLEAAMYQLRVNVQAMKDSHTSVRSKSNTTQFLLHDREVDYSASTSISTRDPQKLIALGESCISPALMMAASHDKSYNVLPPIPSRVQGPFKKPEEVIRQRFKPLQPTLRVATAYDSVETARAEIKAKEWRQRINDNKFLPFSKQTYEIHATVNSTIPYERPSYGNQHFRDTDSTRNIAKVDFQTTIPSIPVFEKLNSTY